MRVRITKPSGSSRPEGGRAPFGSVIEVDEYEAQRLVRLGHAEVIEDAPPEPIAEKKDRAYTRGKKK